MSLDQPPLTWTAHLTGPVLATAGALLVLLAGACALIIRRTSGAVLTAGIGALICTAYSGDTSWRFAEHRLGMTNPDERLVMFAAGEGALLACAVMARANKRATATDDHAGTPGVPGVLVWCITGIQTIPAFAESGFIAGIVRAVIGPVMAALLWHLAMGLEIRVARPEALSTGLPAQIGHELRERLLSHLGLATRNRSAEEITRDRAHNRVVRLASREHLGPWGRARLAAAVARTHAATDGTRRHNLLQDLAGRRTAVQLRTMDVTSPWTIERVPEAPYPSTPLGVTGDALRQLDPLDAVLRVHAAHPDATPPELASLCTEYGVPVSEAQVRIALHAVPAQVQAPAAPSRTRPTPLELFAAPPVDTAALPAARTDVPGTVEYAYQDGDLHIDVTTETEVRREYASAVPAETTRPRRTRTEVHARVPAPPAGLEDVGAFIRRRAAEERATAGQPRTRPAPDPVPAPVPGRVPVPEVQAQQVPGTAEADVPAELLAEAARLDAEYARTHGRRAPIRHLKTELRIGQPKAEKVRAALNTARSRTTSPAGEA